MSSFFESKKAAAILKHAILNQYIDPFASKTGSTSPNGRVAFIDGYAGEGRYENGDEGSPALLMGKAKKLAPGRKLECYFVEDDDEAYATLCQLIAVEGEGLEVLPLPGKAEDHLESLVTKVAGIPVFVFLDPFGLMIPFDVAQKVFERPKAYGAPATEMLINFNAGGLRRIAGLLTSTKANPGKAASLARMDSVCGGDWWRQMWLDRLDDRDAAEEAVVDEYAKRFASAAKCGYWTTDVRNRADLKPVYYLVFLTRHVDGMSVFGEALSLGLERWRQAVHEVEYKDSLFEGDDVFKDSEQALSAEWIAEIEANLRTLLADGKGFTIISKYADVYGESTGKAREKHLRAAWKRLHTEGVTKTDSKGNLIKKRIEPA
jgi:three-Cys-motif partner protein